MLTGLFSCCSFLGRSITAPFSTTAPSSSPQDQKPTTPSSRAFSILSSALQMEKLGEGDKIAENLLTSIACLIDPPADVQPLNTMTALLDHPKWRDKLIASILYLIEYAWKNSPFFVGSVPIEDAAPFKEKVDPALYKKVLVALEEIKEDITSQIGGGGKIIFPRLSFGTIAAAEGVDPPLCFNRYDLYHITFIKLYFIWPQEHFDDSVLKYCTFMGGRVSNSALERAKETVEIRFIGIEEDESEKLVFMIGKEEIQPKGTPSTPLALLGDLPYTAPTSKHPPQPTSQPLSPDLNHETPPPPPSSATNSEIEKSDVQKMRVRPTRNLYKHFDHNWAKRQMQTKMKM